MVSPKPRSLYGSESSGEALLNPGPVYCGVWRAVVLLVLLYLELFPAKTQVPDLLVQ